LDNISCIVRIISSRKSIDFLALAVGSRRGTLPKQNAFQIMPGLFLCLPFYTSNLDPDNVSTMGNNVFLLISMIAVIGSLTAMYFSQTARRQLREEKLIRENDQLKQVLKDQQELLEEERVRIGHDLHDDLAQLLAGTRLALGNLRLEPSLSERNKSLLLRIDHDLNDLLNRVQNIIWNLSPEALHEKGLSYALWKMCDQLKDLRSFHIEFLELGPTRRLSDPAELVLFRIVQEIVNNAMRHSLAWNINMKMYWSNEQLKIEVKDDGIGRSKSREERKEKGRGLPGIQKRAELIGAKVTAEPVSKGTLYVVSLGFTK
jgi:two-component system NarL family sensor kinase